MKVLSGAIIILSAAIFNCIDCQVHYVPAQILIPTFNGSIATNHSIYGAPAVYNNTNNNRPPYHNSANSSVYNNSTGYNGTQDGHLFVGTIQAFDRLLFNQEYFKARRWYSNREKIIEYPKDLPAGYSRHETISAIRVYNKFYDGNSARAEIVNGGLGRQYVKIKLHSRWGYGFSYLVQIYGH